MSLSVRHTLDHSNLESGGSTNRVSIDMEPMHIKLTVMEGNQLATFEFTHDEWIKFVVGTVPIDDFLVLQGLGGLLRPVGKLPSIPEYQ